MARSNYSAGKRAREADKARKKRDKAERRRRKREEGTAEVPIATVEELQGSIAVADPEAILDGTAEELQEQSAAPRRRGMAVRLFVGGLSWHTEEDTLRKAFAEHGEVLDAAIITDHDGRSRGFGFVTMGSQSAAKTAMEQLDGAELDERHLKVSPARDR